MTQSEKYFNNVISEDILFTTERHFGQTKDVFLYKKSILSEKYVFNDVFIFDSFICFISRVVGLQLFSKFAFAKINYYIIQRNYKEKKCTEKSTKKYRKMYRKKLQGQLIFLTVFLNYTSIISNNTIQTVFLRDFQGFCNKISGGFGRLGSKIHPKLARLLFQL